jgi:serine/threonine-protein kinase
VTARPAGSLERTGKWIRRHPTRSAVLAASFLMALMVLAVAVWLVVREAKFRQVVEADLNDIVRLQDSARWTEARAAVALAVARLGDDGPSDLRQRLAQARCDLALVMRLDAIRLSRATGGELIFYKGQADRDYQAAFGEAGLGGEGLPSVSVAERVKTSSVRSALIAALDDWAVCASDKGRRNWVLDVARQADPDPDGWRDRIRNPATWDNRTALDDLARTVPAGQSVSLLLALGERLKALRGDAPTFLRRVQKEHPADFWANLVLGNVLLPEAHGEASGYYRAALASRPGAAVGYCAVGDTLRLEGALAEASEYYQKALQVDRYYARAYSNLGLTLLAEDRLEAAIDRYRHAVQLDPNYAWAHQNLGNALRRKGQLDEAYEQCRLARELQPRNQELRASLASVMMMQGRGREVQSDWRQFLDNNPTKLEHCAGYAELCLFLGQREEYHRARCTLLDRFGATTNQYEAEPIGRACLLLPGTDNEMRQAVALVDRAVAARRTTPDWIYHYFQFAKGLAEYRLGQLARANSLMQEAPDVLGPAPLLVRAMALYDQGHQEDARKALARAIIAFDWRPSQANSRDVWIIHLLRREAEQKILPQLPAFLRGEHQPRDYTERLALVGACQVENRTYAASRLYAEAFAAEPMWVEEVFTDCISRAAARANRPPGRVEESTAGCRYPAACSAALAGCGIGVDAAELSKEERARLRKLAHAWLRTDLEKWTQELVSGSRVMSALARKVLMRWLYDLDLAAVREPGALDKLPPDENKDWRALWAEVAKLLDRASNSP